jgi:hypothetical protein
MLGAPSRFALATPIPLVWPVAPAPMGSACPPSKVRGKPIPSRRDADAGCGAESGAGAECYEELPGDVIT